jgi:hypothetical protein
MTTTDTMITDLAQQIEEGARSAGATARMLSTWTMLPGDVDLVTAAFRSSLSGDDVHPSQQPTSEEESDALMEVHAADLAELLADVRSAVRDLGRLAMETEEEPVTVTVSVASPTTTGVEGALDVDVTVTLADGTEVEGEVTLARREHDGAWAAYGDAPDYWISGALLAQLHRLGRRAFRDACQEIESSAAAACDEYDAEAAQ